MKYAILPETTLASIVRDEAMNEVEKRERNKEQFIKRVDKDETHKGYDILSKDRKIEVKGRTGTDRFVQMNDENITAFKDNENFWLYIVHFNKDDKCDQYITLDKNGSVEMLYK